MSNNRINISKEIYLWAIKESQKDIEEIKNRFGKIEDWISQNASPTFRQLEDLANFLKVPKVNQETVNKIREIMEFDLENKKTKNSGGNFYITNKSRYSDSFAKSVVNGAESGDISYTYAFELFDGSAKTYDYFKVVMT